MRTFTLAAAGLGLAVLTACPGPTPTPRRPAPAATPVTRETPRTTPRRAVTTAAVRLTADKPIQVGGGAKVTVPARWLVTEHPGHTHVTLREPDGQLWIGLVRVKAPSAEAAISRAWKRLRPGFALRPQKTTTPPVADGWDAIRQTVYQTPSASRRVVLALARGRAGVYYVACIDGKVAAFGRRGAQLRTILASLKAPGVKKESWAGRTAATLDAAKLATLAAFVEQARKKLGVVGVAMAVVQNGRVVYKHGFGLRDVRKKAPVTPKTLFLIGSITKSLTSMMMAKLVDEKRFTWSSPVTRVYKRFAMGDPAATRRCTMRHTVCACTGLPRQDMEFLFEYKGATAASRMKLLSTMKPTTRFGETFQYSNLLVTAGGYVAAHSAYPRLPLGPAYRKAIQSRLLTPAGMRRTTFDMRRAGRMNHATPHAPSLQLTPTPIPLPWENTVVSVGPAGGAWSNVEDMARFVLLELGRGKTPEGRRLVSAVNVQKRWEPQVRISDQVHYGLAMIINRRHGVRTLGHGGGTLGFSTNMVFWPDHGVGLVTLTNIGGGSGGFNSLVARRFMELVFQGKPKAERSLGFVIAERRKSLAEAAKRMDRHPPRAWITKYAGTYKNASLGTIVVRWKAARRRAKAAPAGGGIMDAGEWQAPIAKHTAKDGVVRLLIGPPLAGLPFEPGTASGKRTLTLRTAQQKYVFTAVK